MSPQHPGAWAEQATLHAFSSRKHLFSPPDCVGDPEAALSLKLWLNYMSLEVQELPRFQSGPQVGCLAPPLGLGPQRMTPGLEVQESHSNRLTHPGPSGALAPKTTLMEVGEAAEVGGGIIIDCASVSPSTCQASPSFRAYFPDQFLRPPRSCPCLTKGKLRQASGTWSQSRRGLWERNRRQEAMVLAQGHLHRAGWKASHSSGTLLAELSA